MDILWKDQPARIREMGTGAPVILVHGYPLDGAMWSGVARALMARFRVLKPDLPGRGDTPSASSGTMEDYADFLEAILKAVGQPAGLAGFSMGGFGALKYAAKYYGHFASVSSHSGPASLRRDGGIVVHWANTSSAAVELNGGSIYGMPFWDQARVSADNPVERLPSYENKRVFLACGLGDDVMVGTIDVRQVRG